MSLNTVLKIGKVLRKSEDSLKYFKYVEPCPVQKDKEGNTIYPLCISIPVNKDFSFDWNKVTITPENERGDLYYLKFKTSDSDGLVKYAFGDIFYSKTAKLKKDNSIEIGESGFYRLENLNHPNAAYRPSSFNRGRKDYEEIYKSSSANLTDGQKFYNGLNKELLLVERILEYIPAIEHFFNKEVGLPFKQYLENETLLKEHSIEHIFENAGISNLKKLIGNTKKDELDENQKEKLFSYMNGSIFIHFVFPNEKHWYQYENDLSLINAKILSDFVDKSKGGLVLKKTLYKTLCSGDKKNDIQFPYFELSNKHKSKSFNDEDIQDLFYAIDYSNKGRLISGTDIKMITLPIGDNLEAKDYEEFLLKKDEGRILAKSQVKGGQKDEPLFDFFSENKETNITSFDVIFCKKGGLTAPDMDLIEISGIEKSNLRRTKIRIEDIASEIYEERKKFIRTDKELSFLGIEFSFRSILGTPQSDNKGKVTIKPNPKYQSHLLKVLPLIYTDKYYNDDVLLPAFIQNVEYSIRAGDSRYSFLKFDLKFLFKIQNNQNDKFMEITNSESYQIGLKLGRLSKPLKKAINSFEKNYVGLLTRRVSSKDDCIKFYNEINEKLVMHKKTWGQSSAEIANELANLPNSKYDKEKMAFGFFEGYFKYEVADKNKDFYTRLEKLLSDYEGNKELENEVEMLNNLYQEIKN